MFRSKLCARVPRPAPADLFQHLACKLEVPARLRTFDAFMLCYWAMPTSISSAGSSRLDTEHLFTFQRLLKAGHQARNVPGGEGEKGEVFKAVKAGDF